MSAAPVPRSHPADPRAAARLVADAVRLVEQGHWQQAVPLLERAAALDPDHLDALRLYAWLALQAGRPHAALPAASRWAALDSRSAEARNVLAIASRQCGRLEDAIASLREAVAIEPTFFDALVNLGNALLDAGDPAAALPYYQRALAIKPDSASVHNNLGNLHRDLHQPTQALAAYRRAVAIDPNHARAHGNIGNILKDLGDIDGAIAAFRHAIALGPDVAETWSNLLLTLACSDRISADQIAEEHRAFGRHFASCIDPLPPVAPEARRAGARLRVGYVSADFRGHAAARFIEPLLAAHDRSRVEVFCYYNQPRGDDVTERLRCMAEHFLPVAGVSDQQLAARIRADGIDVLIDLNGHTSGNRLPLFFLRPAPVQATWLGYLGATGVPTIDWRITDAIADPVGTPPSPGLERPWRLPRTLWCYQPYAQAPDVAPPPHIATGHITFGCCNNPGKVSSSALSAWIDVLRAVPDSRLLLLAPVDSDRRARLEATFRQGGITSDRIEFVARMALSDYLRLHDRIDIGIDTFPYAGGTTTCDALWMGVPVVTLASDRPFGRSGASILAQVALDDLVAGSRAQYVAAAIALAQDRARLTSLRTSLRPRMHASPLADAVAFAREFEDALSAIASAPASPAVRGGER
jgi:predicted O-linked N-acetylglucosamine transferase (SPINDLY family)